MRAPECTPSSTPRAPARWLVALLAATTLAAHPVVSGYERFYAAAEEPAALTAGGLLLLNELNCVACHAAPAAWRERLPGRGKIRLAGGGWQSAAALAAFIADPAKAKPGTTMPRIATDAREPQVLADWVAGLEPVAAPRSYPAGDAKRGQKLFDGTGCAACHAPSSGATGYTSVPIGLAAYRDPGALASFLQDPLNTRPASRMPATPLNDQEAADLAAYLKSGFTVPATGRDTPAGRDPAPADARSLFGGRLCSACHDAGDGAVPPAPAARPLVETRSEQGCLAPSPAPGTPDFSLHAAQRRALAAALRALQQQSSPSPASAADRVAAKFEQLNCYACHEWRGRGGAEAARARWFTATDSAAESLGDLGHLPPKLDAAGRKLTPAWLEKVLWGGGGGVRPYLSARMPKIAEAAAGDLVALLGEAGRPGQPQEIDTSGSRGHQRFETGRTLLGTGPGGLGCVACHGLKDREPPGIRAINLSATAQRLQPEYFKALLLDPQGTQPGTIMPPLFAGRAAADKEIESIWTYFKELDQRNLLPAGLAVAGSLELKPAAEGRPIVFRTFLEGAGTQAIAVGFPAGVHAAFDAYEVRWALAWRGRYLDAQTNWEERPMKPIKPLGDGKTILPNHVSFAPRREPAEPWPVTFGSYAGYAFKGYRLLPDGTPVFRYTVGALEIEDLLRPAPDGASLQRTVTVRRGPGDDAQWHFRGIGPGVAPQPLVWRDGVATIEETISF